MLFTTDCTDYMDSKRNNFFKKMHFIEKSGFSVKIRGFAGCNLDPGVKTRAFSSCDVDFSVKSRGSFTIYDLRFTIADLGQSLGGDASAFARKLRRDKARLCQRTPIRGPAFARGISGHGFPSRV